MIKGMANQIMEHIGQRIFRRGLKRTREILNNVDMMQIFPFVKQWVNDESYIFWLGTELSVIKRSWTWT